MIRGVVIEGDKPKGINAITAPENFMPVTSKIKGAASTLTRTLDHYCVSILQKQTGK